MKTTSGRILRILRVNKKSNYLPELPSSSRSGFLHWARAPSLLLQQQKTRNTTKQKRAASVMRAFACTSTCGAHVRLAGAATQRSPRARITPLSSAPSEHDDVGVWRLSAGRARGRRPPRRPPQRGGRTRARPAAAARTMVRPCDSSVVKIKLAFENTQEGEDPSHHIGVRQSRVVVEAPSP